MNLSKICTSSLTFIKTLKVFLDDSQQAEGPLFSSGYTHF